MIRKSPEKPPKQIGAKNYDFLLENDDLKTQQGLYKPWKEGHIENILLLNDYEQQNNRQHDQKPQPAYEAWVFL